MLEKKHVLLFTAITVGLVILIAGCIAPEEKPAAVISGHQDWYPAMNISGDGKNISGTGVEATQKVLTLIGIKSSSQNVGPWDVVQEKAKTGEIDMIVALYKTKEREEYLYFSDAYMSDPINLFMKTGKEFSYKNKEDLVGKKGVATIGDSYGQEIDDYIVQANLNIIRVSTPQEAFTLLKEEKVDYFIYSLWAGRKVINELNISEIEESETVSNQPFYIGVSKKSPFANRIAEINSSLKKLIANGEIK
jgi:polar amino acid transport system substrate-binding protein